MKFRENTIILSSGKEVYANNLIIGLSADPNESSIYEGYDGRLYIEGSEIYDHDNDEMTDKFTQEELDEIAEFMISRWTLFKLKNKFKC